MSGAVQVNSVAWVVEDWVEESVRQGKGGNMTLRVWLSEAEYAELRRAVAEARLPFKSLLVFQAILAGLQSDKTHGVERRRTRTVNIHVSKEFMDKIRARARMYGVTQQALLRGLLFDYIRNKPWETTPTEPTNTHGREGS